MLSSDRMYRTFRSSNATNATNTRPPSTPINVGPSRGLVASNGVRPSERIPLGEYAVSIVNTVDLLVKDAPSGWTEQSSADLLHASDSPFLSGNIDRCGAIRIVTAFRLTEDDFANSRAEDPPERIARLRSFGEVFTEFAAQNDRFTKFANEVGRTTDSDIAALRQQFIAQGAALQERAAYLKQLQEKKPNTVGKMATARMETVQAAINLIDDWKKQVENSPYTDRDEKLTTLLRYQETLVDRKFHLDGLRNGAAPVSATNRDRKTALKIAAAAIANGNAEFDAGSVSEQDLLGEVLAKMCDEAQLAPDHLKERLAHEVGKVINNRPWNEIDNRIELNRSEGTIKLDSVIRPAGKLPGALFAAYDGKGVNSQSAMEGGHAVNLARSELKSADGRMIFAGFRHSVNCAYGIRPGEMAKLPEKELVPLLDNILRNADPEINERLRRAIKPGGDAADVGSRNLARMIRAGGSTAESICNILRRQANVNRARECIQAAVLGDPAKRAEATEAADKGETLSLNINSISLLTPDKIRSARGLSNAAEQIMLDEQSDAWKALSENPTEIALPDGRTVKVQAQATTLNFGVNAGAVGPIASIDFLDLASGWDDLKKMNGEALTALIGDPAKVANGQIGGRAGAEILLLDNKIDRCKGELLDPELNEQTKARLSGELPVLQKRRQAIEQLAQQIAGIWNDNSYQQAGSEPYKIVSRLAVLSHLLGDATFWNCKSGKDRTGELDLEAKYLAELIDENGGAVPTPNRSRTPAEKKEFYEFMLGSGNFEMQEMNTLYGGFRLMGVDALYDQIGAEEHPERKGIYLGFSAYTSA